MSQLKLTRLRGQAVEVYTASGVIRFAIAASYRGRCEVLIDAPEQCRILRDNLDVSDQQKAQYLAQANLVRL